MTLKLKKKKNQEKYTHVTNLLVSYFLYLLISPSMEVTKKLLVTDKTMYFYVRKIMRYHSNTTIIVGSP